MGTLSKRDYNISELLEAKFISNTIIKSYEQYYNQTENHLIKMPLSL